MTTSRYPLDFDGLAKGQVLSEEMLSAALSLKPRDGTRWAFGLLALQQQIQERLGFIAKIDGAQIRILTDLEADEWTANNITLGVRRLVRNTERRQLIDRSSFSGEEKAAAECRDRIAVATSQAALRAHREAKALEHARAKVKQLAEAKEELHR